MARIIENVSGSRRIIKLSAADVVSVVADYNRIVPRGADFSETIDKLQDKVIYIPEDV